MKNSRSVPMFLGAWCTKPDWTEQNQMCSHGSQEHGINSTLPHLGSLMVFKRSSDLPKSPPVWSCRAIRHSGGLCAQGPLHSFTAGRSSWEKCTISRKPPWEAKIIAHATFRPTHHLNHFFIKKEVLSRANMAPLWIHCGIWATGLKRAAEELMEKERWREEMEGRREGHHFRTLSSGRVGG